MNVIYDYMFVLSANIEACVWVRQLGKSFIYSENSSGIHMSDLHTYVRSWSRIPKLITPDAMVFASLALVTMMSISVLVSSKFACSGWLTYVLL